MTLSMARNPNHNPGLHGPGRSLLQTTEQGGLELRVEALLWPHLQEGLIQLLLGQGLQKGWRTAP